MNWRPAGFGAVVIKKAVILNLFQNLLLGSFAVWLSNKVILEGFYPGSVVFVVAVPSFILKGLFPFFFFVKILIIRGGCTRMYPVYKTRIKGRFGRLYKDKK